MQLGIVQRIIGLLLLVFSLTMLPPVLVSLIYGDGATWPFVYGFLLLIATGSAIYYPARNRAADLRLHHGFIIVVSFWTVLGFSGALPLYFDASAGLGFTDAMFESFSGLTTTGATVIPELKKLPKAILFYRQQLQWLGGMGIIVLAVAVLPMLGVGGMQLYRAETPGPIKDSKLTPRITETAKALWLIYLGLTIACAVSYMAVGMGLFDAICHSFSTVAIGGFSPYDDSLGHFNKDGSGVRIVCIVFMLLSGVNFALHFVALRSVSVRPYLRDYEFRGYLVIIFSICCIVTATLALNDNENLLDGVFQVVSFATTTGFTTTSEYDTWPGLIPALLLGASFIGGCAGSTGGGMKVVRVLLVYRQGLREIMRLIHPNGTFVVKLGDKAVTNRVVDSVWGFFSMYVALFLAFMLILQSAGMDGITSFSAIAACLNNLGPGLDGVASNYAAVPDSGKWTLMLAMLMGRLEIFSLLVLLTPAFWRR